MKRSAMMISLAALVLLGSAVSAVPAERAVLAEMFGATW